MPKLIYWFDKIDKEDAVFVGDKAVNLADLKNNKFPIPKSFTISSQSFFHFLENGGLNQKIDQLLQKVDREDKESQEDASKLITHAIRHTPIPKPLEILIVSSYQKLLGSKHDSVEINPLVTSSHSSQVPKLNERKLHPVKNKKQLLDAIKESWLLLFHPQVIKEALEKGIEHTDLGLSLTVQKFIQPETSGKLFTVDYNSGDNNKIIIEAVWGISKVTDSNIYSIDSYEIDKQSSKLVFKHISSQENQIIYIDGKERIVPVSKRFRSEQKLTDEEITKLAVIGKKLDSHYGFPQEVYWVLENGDLSILEVKPINDIRKLNKPVDASIEERLPIIMRGDPAFPGIATGIPKIVNDVKDLTKVQPGDVIVTSINTQKFPNAMKKSVAIITNTDGYKLSLNSKKLGIPQVVNAINAINLLKNYNSPITVNGTNGQILKGSPNPKVSRHLDLAIKTISKKHLLTKDPSKTATKIFVSTGEKDLIQELVQHNVDGVLLRSEQILSEIGIHPQKFIEGGKQGSLINKLADGITAFASAFDPKPVIYRTNDFTSEEYKNLKHAEKYETPESNPLLGFRGGTRYAENPEELKVELEAVKKVRNKLGFKNLWVAVSFIRSVEEMEKIKKIASSVGLHRSNTFKLLLMVQVPSNVLLVEKFLDSGIDGMYIDLDDLTTLTLGADKSNRKMSKKFNALDPAILAALEKIIKECGKRKLYSGVFGQAPYIYPELSDKLVRWGVSSVSVSPQTVVQTKKIISESEKNLLFARKN